jgi:hypothetical protein
MECERALGASSMAGTQWCVRTAAQRRATAEYVRGIRPALGVWSKVLHAITSAAMLDVEAHFYPLLMLRSELEAIAVPPDGEYAHVALIAAFEHTLLACSAILTHQPRDVVDRARDEALISFNAFEIEIVYLAGVEHEALAPA